MVRPVLFATWCLLLCGLQAASGLSLAAAAASDGAVWTAIIPDAFPGYVYTWRMEAGGSYREDGRDAARGQPIQQTLSGHWARDGAHMILRQDGLPYVFDGVVAGDSYAGTLYLGGRAVSRFCAARGDEAPGRCDKPANVATIESLPRPAVVSGGGRSRLANQADMPETKNLRQGIAGGFGGLALRGSVSARLNRPAMLHRLAIPLP